MTLGLAMIEGRWFSHSNVSVKGIFDLLSDIHIGTPHGFHYEMFNNSDAFREIVQRLGEKNGIHNLYVACHGNEDHIVGTNGEEISKKTVRDALRDVARTRRAVLKGLYFGACNFVDDDLAHYIFGPGEVGISWIAGYSKSVNWVNSSALDWCFWNEYFRRCDKPPVKRIEETAAFLSDNLDGLCKKLGFKLYRKKGEDGVIRLI